MVAPGTVAETIDLRPTVVLVTTADGMSRKAFSPRLNDSWVLGRSRTCTRSLTDGGSVCTEGTDSVALVAEVIGLELRETSWLRTTFAALGAIVVLPFLTMAKP